MGGSPTCLEAPAAGQRLFLGSEFFLESIDVFHISSLVFILTCKGNCFVVSYNNRFEFMVPTHLCFLTSSNLSLLDFMV